MRLRQAGRGKGSANSPLALVALCALVLSNCETTNMDKFNHMDIEISAADLENDRCGAQETRQKLNFDPTYLAELRLKMQSGDRLTRVIEYGAPMTRDYRPERLTVMLDESGKPKQIRCV